MGVFNKLFGRLRITSDANVSTQTTSIIQTDTTNSSIAIVPNGTGAIIASIPDGAATGGNARGANAVDLQMSRSASNQVASGIYSHIGGGLNNTASDEYAVVAGGTSNIASGRRSFIGGGTGNTAGAIFNNSVIGGSGNVSTGGESIAGGYGSQATGSRSVAFGLYGTASGGGSFAMAGTASGGGSVAFQGANAGNTNVFAHGDLASSTLYGSLTKANGGFTSSVISSNQRAQTHSVIARREAALTTGGTTVLSLDGTGVTNLISIGTSNVNYGGAWNVRISYIAIVTGISGTATGITIGDTKTQNIEIGLKSVNLLPVTLVGAGSYSIAQEDASMNTATLTPSALPDYLNLTFTAPTFAGGGSVTFRVVAKVELVEVRYGT